MEKSPVYESEVVDAFVEVIVNYDVYPKVAAHFELPEEMQYEPIVAV